MCQIRKKKLIKQGRVRESLTRTKTSIRYAKENDKEKRERRRERVRKVEGEIERGRER